jgi:acyl carrier protein
MTKDDMLMWVKNDLIYQRLKLGDMGFTMNDIHNDVPLFDSEGLDLDSVDGLELAVGIEQKWGVKLGKMDDSMAKDHFQSPNTIANFVLELQNNRSEGV